MSTADAFAIRRFGGRDWSGARVRGTTERRAAMPDSTPPQFAVGIDLGTTHCALSWARLDRPVVRSMAIPQLAAPGVVEASPLLPSFLYLASPGEIADGDRGLPWGAPEHLVGRAARQLGAKVPNRLVASAKSWICHGGVDRKAAILPWNAPESDPHISPWAAQVEYLAHLEAAWRHAHPEAPLADQDVVVTVPASFDEGARELTTQAAAAAGLGAVRLLEEPQAAFYDWLGTDPAEVDARLGDAKLVLVIDVGGGTTDLTLLRVRPHDDTEGGGRIERIAVGGHLMLGGDNMDAALAMFALTKANLPRPEDATIWSGLVQSAREAKERLLQGGDDAPNEAVISIQSRGSRLVGNTRSITVDRAEATAVLLDGFLPYSGPADVAVRGGKAGLTTLGLPYTSDTAIARHVCTFLRRHAAAAADAGATIVDGLPRPDRVLLNGGVFNGSALVDRLMDVLAQWYGGETIARLDHTSLDLAVAHGAVRSILARWGIGEAIAGGTARAYYIGVGAADGSARALCVAPRGLEPGTSVDVPDRVFDLVLDQPVSFPLFEYTGDHQDPPGALAEPSLELEPLPPLATVLRDATKTANAGPTMVTLRTMATDHGALEVFLVTVELPPRRWRLDFVLRREAPPVAAATASTDEIAADDLAAPVRAAIDAALTARDEAGAKQLRAVIEKHLGPRGQWSAGTCRAVADACLARVDACKTSETHELNWLRIIGWCLRPGYGVRGDDARLDAMWRHRETGLAHASKAMWSEWWIVWRRLAAGLDATRQRALFAELQPWLWRNESGKPPAGPHRHGPVEMMQLASALERVDAPTKVELGELLLAKIDKLGSYWPLGRVGARMPLRGEPGDVVSPEVAERWLGKLLAIDLVTNDGASFAAAQLARMTGDATRDVSPAMRQSVIAALTRAKASASWIDMVMRPVELTEGDRARLLGDALPVGLRLG